MELGIAIGAFLIGSLTVRYETTNIKLQRYR